VERGAWSVERGAWSVESEEWSRNWEWAVIGVRDGSVWCGAVLCCAVVRCCAVFVTTLRRPISHKFVRNISSYHIARRIISLVVSYRSSYRVARRIIARHIISHKYFRDTLHRIAPVSSCPNVRFHISGRCNTLPAHPTIVRTRSQGSVKSAQARPPPQFPRM
jgi:hypothetical protein